MEKILVLQPDNRLAVVEVASKSQTVIFNPQLLTDALMRAVEYYSPAKVKALSLSQPIKAVTDADSLSSAKDAQGRLAAIRIDAEKDRKFFTQPFLDSQRFIKEQYDLLSVGLTKEEKRLDALVQGYAQEVERLRQQQLAEQRKRDEESARKIREYNEEAARLAAEAAAAVKKADEVGDFADIEEAEIALEKAEEAAFAAELAEVTAPAVVEIAAPVGKPMLDFELEHAGTRHELQDILIFAKMYPE